MQAPNPDAYRGIYNLDNTLDMDLGERYGIDMKERIDALHKKGRKIAAFYAESLQSCAGQVIHPPNYLRNIYK